MEELSQDNGWLHPFSQSMRKGDAEAMDYMKQAIANGKHWFIALLEAIKLWNSAEEEYEGRIYRYLIDGEAFDWLSLAERLCLEVDGLISEEEKVALLFSGKSPVPLTKEEFRSFIGNVKYRAYLNFFYGVMVEESLQLAVDEEVRKEWRQQALSREEGINDEVYLRIYGSDERTLLQQFRGTKGYPQHKSLSLNEGKEFTYWLFKYRMERCDKARVASDTKKALSQLERYSAAKNFSPEQPEETPSQIIELTPDSYSL